MAHGEKMTILEQQLGGFGFLMEKNERTMLVE